MGVESEWSTWYSTIENDKVRASDYYELLIT